MRRWFVLLVLPLLLVAARRPAHAQGTTGGISGRVLDSVGMRPLQGARVSIVGTTQGAMTREDGSYLIAAVAAGTHTLRVNMIGYGAAERTVTVAAGQTATADFTLSRAAVQLEQVVVVGYGTQERERVTGAVATVQAQQIQETPTANPIKAIQGRVPGVEITSSNNLPGAPMNIRIRGVRSLTASNDPLFVVDGIPLSGGIGDFDPGSIENISILKDAAATAIYGSRGANGVVLITTKGGASAGRLRTQVSLDAYTGAQRPLQLIDMMNMQQYTEMLQAAARYQTFVNGLAGRPASDSICSAVTCVLDRNELRAAWESGTQTDWQRAILRTGMQRNVQGSLNGNTASSRFNLSGSWFDQSGLAIGQSYDRGAALISADHQFGRLRLGLTANGARSTQDQGAGDGLWGTALAQTGFGAPTDAEGRLLAHPDGDAVAFNPLRTQEFFLNQFTRNRVFGSAFAQFTLLEGLDFRTNFGPDYTSEENGQFQGPDAIYPGHSDSRASLRNTQTFAYTVDNLLQLNRDLGSAHHVDGTLLYGVQRQRQTLDSASAQQLPYNEQRWYALNTGSNPIVRSNLSEWALESFMGRLSYTLLDRYTISGAVRRDGSSRLAEGNKWATFPSVGLAWQIGNESFMQRFGFLSALKLRGSYGVTGNTAIQPYQTQGALNRTVYNFGPTNGFGYGPDQGNPANPFLSWEKTYQSDVGLEFGVFADRVTGTVDYYRQNTRDLLMRRTLPVTSGYRSALQNIGETMNRGVEVGISTMNVRNWRGLQWTSDFNWASNHNEILKLATADTTGCPVGASPCDLNNAWFVGQPINISTDAQRRVWYDYKMIGIWQTPDSALARSFGTQFRPGEIRIADINGDNRITSADRVILGSTFPKWTGSVYNRVTWRGLDVSALATIRWDYTLFDDFGVNTNTMQGRLGNIVTDYWTPESPSASQPAPRLSGNVVPFSSTRGYQDGSHWRIRNVTLGYTVPARLSGRIRADRVRVYATAQDPVFFSDYEGYDPENGTSGGAPAYRTLLVGANFGW
jgi:TonB-linked SusC/RagA family outer membrane protein